MGAAAADCLMKLMHGARHLGISRRLLDLRFRQYAGMTVTDTINAARLTEAKRLLRQTKLSVHAALSAAGFNDLSYAHRLFKRTTGLSPLAFRRHRTA